MALVLLVDDDVTLRHSLRERLSRGHIVLEAGTDADAAEQIRRYLPQIIVASVRVTGRESNGMLTPLRQILPDCAVIAMTTPDAESIASAARLSANAFIFPPFDPEFVVELVDRAASRWHDSLEAEASRRHRERNGHLKVVAESSAMREIVRAAAAAAGAGSTNILIEGERGSGKSVLARHIHTISPRGSAPLLEFHCGAVPEHLVESELFGCEQGAFADARSDRKGLVELAHGGTVVLREICEMPLPVQTVLLRFLESGSFRRSGGSTEIPGDVRLIATTNRSVGAEVARGYLLPGLLDRLRILTITVPPLRERREDIMPLALAFMKEFAPIATRQFQGISRELRDLLARHPFPHNVRELRNLIERTMMLEESELLTSRPLAIVADAGAATRSLEPQETIVPLEEVEFVMVQRALRATNGNQSQAARLLQVSRDQLRYRVKRYRDAGRLPGEVAAGELLN